MMRPLRWARIWGRTALVMRMRPKTLMLNSLWSCARELGGTGGADAGVVDQDVDLPEPPRSPAGPRCRPTPRWPRQDRGTSHRREVTLEVFRLVPTTSKPASTSASAAAFPIPEDAPVTSATGRFVDIMTFGIELRS